MGFKDNNNRGQKGGKGPGKGGAKRRRHKVLRNNIQGITKPAIRRLARCGGVKHISGLIYEDDSAVFVYLGPDGDPVPPKVQHVQVHESVTFIPEKAFHGCMDLVMVELPEGLVRIHAGAFKGCKSLRNISIPSSVIRVDNSAFWNCDSLKDVELHEGLQKIGISTFNGCKSLCSISVPSSVTSIGFYAFHSCESLKDVELHEGLQRIGMSTFVDCKSLRSISIPSSVTLIAKEAFKDCHELMNVKLHHGLLEIEQESFRDCYSLRSISIPSSVCRIGNGAFYKCYSLKVVQLPEGLQRIGMSTFVDCKSLQGILIPSSVIRICFRAFAGCYALRDVKLCEGIQEIGDSSFMECSALPHISIPSSVTIIGQSAFRNCGALWDVKLREGSFKSQRISCEAFKGCPLFHIDIPSSVSIIDRAFEGCKLLRNISISPRTAISYLNLGFEPFRLLDSRLSRWGSIYLTRHRFDGLAIHGLCFSCMENKSDQLKLALHNKPTDDVESALLQRDCIGMTPLHVLSCMGSHDAPSIESIEFLVQQCPRALTIEDGWGDTPFVYLLLSEAPLDMMSRFLCQHYDELRVLDFENVMLKLATMNKGISDVFLRHAVCTLRQCMANKRPTTNNSMTIPQHDLNIDWERIIDAVKEGVQQWSVSHKVFQVLVEASASKQLNCGAVIHHTELQDSIHERCVRTFPQHPPWEHIDYDQIRSDYDENETIIRDLVRKYDQKIREATSLVELLVWKVHLHEYYNMTQRNLRRIRKHSRAKCGVGIIIPNVMSFL